MLRNFLAHVAQVGIFSEPNESVIERINKIVRGLGIIGFNFYRC